MKRTLIVIGIVAAVLAVAFVLSGGSVVEPSMPPTVQGFPPPSPSGDQ